MTATRKSLCRFFAAKVATIALFATAACAAPVGQDGEDIDNGSTDGEMPAPGTGAGAKEATGIGPATGGNPGSGGATGSGGGATGGVGGGSGGNETGGTGGSGGGSTSTTPGLEALYSFEDTGAIIADDSGHAHDGTLSSSGASLTKGGKFGNALSFSGGSGYVRVSTGSSFEFTSAASIEFWVKLSSVTAGTIISRLSPSGDGLRIRSTQGNLQVTFSRANAGAVIATSDAGILGSTWSHVAIVNDGSELRLYVDGKLHRTATGGKLGYVGTDLFVGAGGANDNAINGYVDEVSFWSVARTPEDVCKDAGAQWSNGSCL